MLSRELMCMLIAETGLLPCGVAATFRGSLRAQPLVAYAKRPVRFFAQQRTGISTYLDS